MAPSNPFQTGATMSLTAAKLRPLIALMLASVAAPALAATAAERDTAASDPAATQTTGSAAATSSQATSIIVSATRDGDRLPDQSGTLIFAGKLGDIAVLSDIPPVPTRNLRVALADIPGLLVSEVSNGSWASLSYRGLGEPHESWNILTLQDAVPAVPDMYSYPAGYFTPPLEAVERIDVMFAIERDINVLLSRSGCVFARTVAALSSSRCRPLREQRASLSRNSDTAKAINCCLSLRCIGHLAASSMKGAVIFRECRRARTRGNRRAAI